MRERAVRITETYTPGKNLGATRTVTVHDIPATEVTYDGVTDVHLSSAVADRVDHLIDSALNANDAGHQVVTYTGAELMRPSPQPPEHRTTSSPRGRHRRA